MFTPLVRSSRPVMARHCEHTTAEVMDNPQTKKRIIMSDITLNVFILARSIGLNLDLLESNLINLLILDIGLFYVLGDILEGLLNTRLRRILSELFRRKKKCSRSFRMTSRAGKFVSLHRSDTWQTVYGKSVKQMATKAKILAAKELFSNLPPYPKKLSPSLKKFLTTVPIIDEEEWLFSRQSVTGLRPSENLKFPYARYRRIFPVWFSYIKGRDPSLNTGLPYQLPWRGKKRINLPLGGSSSESLLTIKLASGGFNQTRLLPPFPSRLLAGHRCRGLFTPEDGPEDLSVLADKSFEIAGLLHGRPNARYKGPYAAERMGLPAWWGGEKVVNLPLGGLSRERLITVKAASGVFRHTRMWPPFPARMLGGKECRGVFNSTCHTRDLSTLSDKSFEIAGLLHGRPNASTLNRLKGRLLTKSEKEVAHLFASHMNGQKKSQNIPPGIHRGVKSTVAHRCLKKSLKDYRLSKYGGSFLTKSVNRRYQIVAPWCRFVSPDWSLSLFRVSRKLCLNSGAVLVVPYVRRQDLYKPSLFPKGSPNELFIQRKFASSQPDYGIMTQHTEDYFCKRLFDFMCSSLSQ